MTKEKLAIEVIKRLKTAYPRTDCTLEYDEAGSSSYQSDSQPSALMPA